MNIGRTTLGSLDWIIVILYGIGMLAVGFYFSRKNKSSDDYMLGGRNMKSWRVGLSLFATLFSAVSYLSLPGEMIKHGPMIWCLLAAIPFIYIIVSYLFIPFIMKLKISSAYELLETRLGKKNRILASVYFLIMRFVWMSVIIYMCADKVIVPIMGWSESTALWGQYHYGCCDCYLYLAGRIKRCCIDGCCANFYLVWRVFACYRSCY